MPSKFLNLDTDPTLSANSDYHVPSQKAIKTFVGTKQDVLTNDQLAAVNSGITADKVADYDAYATSKADKADTYTKTEIDTALQGKVDDVKINGTTVVSNGVAEINADTVVTQNSTNLVTSGAVFAAIGSSGGGTIYSAGEGIDITNGVISSTVPVLYKEQNITVSPSAFVSDKRYSPYEYRADIEIQGITANHYPNVIFSIEDSLQNNFAPFSESGEGYVSIWCEQVPTNDLFIPLITYE